MEQFRRSAPSNIYSLAALGYLAISLAACASPASVSGMTANPSPIMITTKTSARNAVFVGEVTGGKKTNPAWTSQVDNIRFKEALERSLLAARLLAPTDKRTKYTVTAKLTKLVQPFAGFNMTVSATVKYAVSVVSEDKPVIDRSIISTYTAPFGAALYGVERLRLANEGAIRRNIEDFIQLLIRKTR